MKRNLLCCLFAVMAIPVLAQTADRIHYTGTELSNPAYHDGQLMPVVGVHNIQVLRANREHPDVSNGFGWTYNHQPMLAYWNGQFYLQYLADPADEHVPPSQTFIMTSRDGYHWTNPVVAFPNYKVPDGYTKESRPGQVAKDLIAIMHQRVGFYVSKSGKLITMANYGVALDKKDDPNDGNGIGRVVREIHRDGTFGPIYFIYYNHGFNEKNTDYPYFRKSKDKAFRQACEEILANPLYRMQWVEEADREDPIIPLKKGYKAFNSYTLPDGRIACLWKHALTSISEDGGNTWAEPVLRAKGFVNSNAKIWGQRLTDGTYATVYNPSEFRWPLAISLSKDGLEYTTLNLVHGEITPMRYGGNYKSYGPQYPRGIQEGNGVPADSSLWVSYSMNKEDMWVSRIPVPVRDKATAQVDDDFSSYNSLADMTEWNIYAPLWAPVSLEKKMGRTWLTLSDKDPFDYAKVERIVPAGKQMAFSFDLMAEQNDRGTLQIEFQDENGISCSRLELTPDGVFRAKGGARFGNLMKYEAGKVYSVKVLVNTVDRNIQVFVDGKKVGTRMLYAPVASVCRMLVRTGILRDFPTPETPADQDYDLPNAGEQDALAVFRLSQVKSEDLEAGGAVLDYSDFSHYAAYFNGMEPEAACNEQAIPNALASEWMEQNIPLFECPQSNFEQMYYFRWWTLRKHIKQTPVGYAMTEFLVNRSYADQWNLISCAVGHHINESRWLRNPEYLDQIINTWYHGNEGQPMKKMMNFSSWNPYAIYQRYLADGNQEAWLAKKQDLMEEYTRWENTHRLPDGLYWQGDVQDGMEETISGGRRKKYARPTINSYMYGNAVALSELGKLSGDAAMQRVYAQKADTLRHLIETKLWSEKQQFFETLRTDTLANVREFIGYLPWYFNMVDDSRYEVAWKQLTDEKGFSAPYGLTTAERRHPEFRTRGVGKCEWDGAIWPFATAQVLTALANYLNSTETPVVTDSVYFRQLELYVESQSHRGRPYIGEYLDEKDGHWLKDDQLRSYYYNHSTFNDLLITGLVGIRPRADRIVEVNPLLPEGKWDWFCLDALPYHGHLLTVIWDKDGSRYHQGKGLRVLVDGKSVGQRDTLGRLVCEDVLTK